MGKRILGKSFADTDVTASAVPDGTGDIGITMRFFSGAAKTQWFLLGLNVRYIADDIYVYGAAPTGTVDDPTDDVWGLHQDEYATFPLGHVGTLSPGKYEFIVDGLGLYSYVAIRTGGATQKASLALGTLGSGALDTIVEAQTAGLAGEAITVALIGDNVSGVTIQEVSNAVTIHYETAVSTVGDVETAITATSTLIEVKTAGTDATVLVAATDHFAATHLIGGGTHVDVTLSEILDGGRGN